MYSARDQNNLAQFRTVVTRAYQQAKSIGRISVDIEKYDKALALGPVTSERRDGKIRKVFVDRIWRRRVARLYWHQHHKPLRGLFESDIDWNAIYNWVLENIVPIMKLLMMLVPLLI